MAVDVEWKGRSLRMGGNEDPTSSMNGLYAFTLPRRSQARGGVGREAVSQAPKAFRSWCNQGGEAPSSQAPAAVEERKGNDSDGRLTGDQQ